MWFNIDFQKLVLWFLPFKLRKPKNVAILSAMVAVLQQIHGNWLNKRERNLYLLAHNGQTCYFRKALNDAFDNELRRIQIVNGNVFEEVYIFTEPENEPEYLDAPLFIYGSQDYAETAVDFIVRVPAEIVDTQLIELRAEIDYYRQAGKRFKIEST